MDAKRWGAFAMTSPSKVQILEQLNLGSSVAENDDNLESYFVPTIALDDFLSDRYDLIRGAKGSGKSAILRMVSRGSARYAQLGDVVPIVATEHTGEPAFKRAFEPLVLTEVTDAALTNAWKTYILNLALDAVETLPDSDQKSAAIRAAEACSLRYRTPSSFKKIWWSLLRMLHIKSVGVGADSISAEFPDAPPEFWTKDDSTVDFPELLKGIVAAFDHARKRCWILMDRLDAAFQDRQELERRALRSLLVAYKDFMGHRSLRVKLFFRTDLYDTVTRTAGFRELTHVADRASPPITWDPDKLLQFLMERFAFNAPVCEKYGFSRADVADPDVRTAAFFSIFPNQIDVGERKGDSWTWMCSRIRDGNSVRTPRDLHGLVQSATQKEREQLALGRGEDSAELVTAPAVKMGLAALSEDKVRTTLIAENPDLENAIRAFRAQKAEQNSDTLEILLGANSAATVEHLVKIGFLEKLASSWKVPMLYRDGLDIIQGAAFPKGEGEDKRGEQ
jgi:hypothetical protein